MDKFFNAYEALLDALKASSDEPSLGHARLVGALKVIIPFTVDEESLAKLTAALQDSTKRETFEILKKDPV